jgi:UDP-N-acetylglucosamine acyltransferase
MLTPLGRPDNLKEFVCMSIHPWAVIHPKAELAANVEVGPFAVIEEHVRIGEGTRVYPNAYISGWTTIGSNCQIHPNAVVGHMPQDFHFSGERSYCEIGDGTILRECASIHRGTQPESVTRVGKNCFILAYAHLGHNCVLGDGVKVYNNCALAGHVEVEDNAIISGTTLVHQFVRIGRYTMIGGGGRILQDIAPYMSYAPDMGVFGVNRIGLRRNEFSAETIAELGRLYDILFASGLLFPKAVEQAAEVASTDAGRHLVEFCRVKSKRGMEGGPDRKRSRREQAQGGGEIEGGGA